MATPKTKPKINPKPQTTNVGGRFRWQSDDRMAIVGQPGTGKTTLTRYLATHPNEDRLKIYDPLDQYREFPDKCRVVPKDSDPVAEFDQFCKEMMARGRVTVFIEEAQRYLPQQGKIGDNALMMLNRGRNYGIGVVACSQRIQHVNKNFFDLCQRVIFFRCGYTSRSYIRDLVPLYVATQVYNLPDHMFLYYDLRTDRYGRCILQLPRDAKPDTEGVPASAQIMSAKEESKSNGNQGNRGDRLPNQQTAQRATSVANGSRESERR